MSQDRGGSSQGPGEIYKDYTVYDQHYEKVGKVDDLFVDENDQPEYIGVKIGFLGTKSTLIPIELVRVNDRRKLVEVAADESTIKGADRKSTRLNSSHANISYAVFCLKKKNE